MRLPLLLLAGLAAAATTRWSYAQVPPKRAAGPNIVLIVADDMGIGDLGCYNPSSKIPTPNIDRLAARGIRFTDAHAPGSVCVPSRYGLLTGRYPFRNQGNVQKESLIEPGRATLASLLRDRGYATAMVGKWHLGFDGGNEFDYAKPLRGGPIDRGFDTFYGMHASLDIPPYFYIEGDRATAPATGTIEASSSPDVTPIQGAFWRAGRIAPDFRHGEVLGRFTQKAVDFLQRRNPVGVEKPFFLYLALAAPHTPWLPAQTSRLRSGAGSYGDFAAEVDDTVGQVLSALDSRGLSRNTLVIFTSDNGPVWYPADVEKHGHASTGTYRGMKGDAWEGGHRMPLIARWPGRIQPSSTSKDTVCFTDLLSTFAELTGKPLPEGAGEDSFSLVPALLGRAAGKPVREATVHQSSRGVLALRQGKWKLIPALGSGGFSPPATLAAKAGEPAGQLYDLEADPGELNNVYAQQPEVVKRLTAVLQRYRDTGRSRPAKP